jgi:aryl-alcohol dehydrogenase (NADP+)
LTRDWDETTARSETDEFGKSLYSESDKKVVDTLAEFSKIRRLKRAQVALAWVLQKDVVAAPIVGATKPEHITDAVEALSIKLSAEDIKLLEQPYEPHAVQGFK